MATKPKVDDEKIGATNIVNPGKHHSQLERIEREYKYKSVHTERSQKTWSVFFR